MAATEMDYFTISSDSDDEDFSMWRKVEEEHCVARGEEAEPQRRKKEVEVECNIKPPPAPPLPPAKEVQPLPQESNVSPDSGIQSAGDSPLRIECEMLPPPPSQNGNHHQDFFDGNHSSNNNNRTEPEGVVKGTPSPPILTPAERAWSGQQLFANSQSHSQKVDDPAQAPLLRVLEEESVFHNKSSSLDAAYQDDDKLVGSQYEQVSLLTVQDETEVVFEKCAATPHFSSSNDLYRAEMNCQNSKSSSEYRGNDGLYDNPSDVGAPSRDVKTIGCISKDSKAATNYHSTINRRSSSSLMRKDGAAPKSVIFVDLSDDDDDPPPKASSSSKDLVKEMSNTANLMSQKSTVSNFCSAASTSGKPVVRRSGAAADNELHMLVLSVQDSISSQFQGAESDELSDVDVSGIPVTALSSDTFCDRLSAEDNILNILQHDANATRTDDELKATMSVNNETDSIPTTVSTTNTTEVNSSEQPALEILDSKESHETDNIPTKVVGNETDNIPTKVVGNETDNIPTKVVDSETIDIPTKVADNETDNISIKVVNNETGSIPSLDQSEECNETIPKKVSSKSVNSIAYDIMKGTISDNIQDYEELLEIPVIITDDNEPTTISTTNTTEINSSEQPALETLDSKESHETDNIPTKVSKRSVRSPKKRKSSKNASKRFTAKQGLELTTNEENGPKTTPMEFIEKETPAEETSIQNNTEEQSSLVPEVPKPVSESEELKVASGYQSDIEDNEDVFITPPPSSTKRRGRKSRRKPPVKIPSKTETPSKAEEKELEMPTSEKVNEEVDNTAVESEIQEKTSKLQDQQDVEPEIMSKSKNESKVSPVEEVVKQDDDHVPNEPPPIVTKPAAKRGRPSKSKRQPVEVKSVCNNSFMNVDAIIEEVAIVGGTEEIKSDEINTDLEPKKDSPSIKESPKIDLEPKKDSQAIKESPKGKRKAKGSVPVVLEERAVSPVAPDQIKESNEPTTPVKTSSKSSKRSFKEPKTPSTESSKSIETSSPESAISDSPSFVVPVKSKKRKSAPSKSKSSEQPVIKVPDTLIIPVEPKKAGRRKSAKESLEGSSNSTQPIEISPEKSSEERSPANKKSNSEASVTDPLSKKTCNTIEEVSPKRAPKNALKKSPKEVKPMKNNKKIVVTVEDVEHSKTEIVAVSKEDAPAKVNSSKKVKVEEEKENFGGIRKSDKLPLSKQKAKTSSTKVCSNQEKGVLQVATSAVGECCERERESDALSTMSVTEEALDTYSDACGSSGVDRHSSLELKPLKRSKKAFKAKYADDPTFIAELDDLSKMIKNCYISPKKRNSQSSKTGEKDEVPLPTIFQLTAIMKGRNDRISKFMNTIRNLAKKKPSVTNNHHPIPKAKGVVKKKTKKKGVSKHVVISKVGSVPKVTTNCESDLPLKKRRHVAKDTAAKVAKETIKVPNTNGEAPVIRKTSIMKRIADSFDESIEECIRKQMMGDEKPPPTIPKQHVKKEEAAKSQKQPKPAKEGIPPEAKPKHSKTPTKDSTAENSKTKLVKDTFASYNETIESCVRIQEDSPEEDDEVPLASLVTSTSSSLKRKQPDTRSDPIQQRKKRRLWNKTGFVKVRKRKAKQPVVVQTVEVIEIDAAEPSKEIPIADVDVDVEVAVKKRKRKSDHARKCEIVDLTQQDEVECLGKSKAEEEPEDLDPRYVIQVTDSSNGRRGASTTDSSRKARARREVNFPKKKFLRAGLYSDYFKQDNPSPTSKKSSGSNGSASACSKGKKRSEGGGTKEYIPSEHLHGLMPPPIHVGRYLRERRMEFKLPYDIWWMQKNKQLVFNDESSNNYKKIRTNVYVDIKPDTKNENQACICALPPDKKKKGCGVDCLNRMIYVECVPTLCPCKDRCSNQRFSKHEWSPGLQRFMTKDRGWGIRTTEYIRTGEFILEYVGEVVSDRAFRQRMAERYRHDQHHYCLSLDSGTVIDGYRLAGEGRFVNHSCEPNCEMQKWFVNGHYRVGLFSLRDILPNSELCYDYNFINYNLETQQMCRCGSSKCRGFIGGRSQRLNGQQKTEKQPRQRKEIKDSKKGPGRPKKRKDDKPSEIQKEHLKNEYLPYNRTVHPFTIQMRPMSHQQRCYVQKHHCFLLRNYERVKRARDHQALLQAKNSSCNPQGDLNKQDAFHAQFTALNTARSVKTRRLVNAEEDTELAKTAKLAQVFKDIFTAVTSCKGEDGATLASPFFQLPSKRKNSDYYTKIRFPIDFATIEKNIITGQYHSVDAFEDDFLRLFENAEEFHGRVSELGHKVSLLRKVYNSAKADAAVLFEDILGDELSHNDKSDDKADEDDEVIRCICNIYKDEGLMIQCEKCLVWQHCDCIGVDEKVEKYLCEQCSGIELSKEIVMVPRPHYASPECEYYLTMLLGTLQIKQGDCVYLRRDNEEGGATKKTASEVIEEEENGDVAARNSLRCTTVKEFAQLPDIFRVERLWKDEHNCKYIFGNHYLRPHETCHENSRKFYPNEVLRSNLYEVVPLSRVSGVCCVLDPVTYCRGRPRGYRDEDTYVCEYRVDRNARLFYKIHRFKYPVCTKKYAFEPFSKRRNPKRTYIPSTCPPGSRKKPEANQKERKRRDVDTRLEETPESREKKRTRLNALLLTLLSQQPQGSTPPTDLSHLLEGGGRRRRRVPPTS